MTKDEILGTQRTYYINTKRGYIGKNTKDSSIEFVMEGDKAMCFKNADDAVKLANDLVTNGSVPLARVFYCTIQSGIHPIALIRKEPEGKFKYIYIGRSDMMMPVQGGLQALLNRVNQSRR